MQNFICIHYKSPVKTHFIDILSVPIRDRLIEQLTREIQALKEELESFRLEVTRRRTARHYSFLSCSAARAHTCHVSVIRAAACVRR